MLIKGIGMCEKMVMKAFGPVPSRRLGHSLGVNNIPPKVCTYACVYCQLGRTVRRGAERGSFYRTGDILEAVKVKIEDAERENEGIDYLTFVPDGEPTIDINLGEEIDFLKPCGFRIAVITNASLIWRDDVRHELGKADWVSLKLDALRDDVWRRCNRPHQALQLKAILEGMLAFSKSYGGTLVTETMLVRGLNDGIDHLRDIAHFLSKLKPAIAYISVPIRPPTEQWVEPPSKDALDRAYRIFRSAVDRVEFLTGYEGNAFASTGDVEEDLLSITAVHPMREDAVKALLVRNGGDWSIIEKLVAEGRLKETEYEGKRFYARRLTGGEA
jgi:wyosine [tRNA(Phe)-imidazoG37] synthetase (radical SAM superfamily)